MSDATLRFAIVLQTPKDEQSAVYIGYQSIAQGLERLNHSVIIVAPSDFPRVAGLGGRWTPLVYPFALARWLGGRRDRFDLVLFHSYSGWIASLVGRGRPRALVMFHGVEPLYHRELRAEAQRSGPPLSWRYRFLQEVFMPFVLGVACRSAFGVACLNRTEAAYLRRRGWASDSNLHVLAHGVPPEFFVSSRPRRPIQTLLFVGQWLPMKGVQYLQDAAAILLTRYEDMRLVCAGTLVTADQVIAHFPESLRSRVTVLPRVDQPTLAQLYRDADVLVFPSLYEGFSRAIVEAMASRLPIVCTNVGVAADALRDEHSALIVPTHDAAALVAAVERFRADSDFARRLGDAAAEAARRYTLADVSHQTIDVLIDAARGRTMRESIRERWRRWSMSPALINLTRRRVAFQWRMRGRPLPPPHVVKQLVIVGYQRSRRFDTFVETGTFTGEMVAAMRPHFRRVISIEMAPEIHREAARRFAGDRRVELLLGDSAAVLPQVLEQIRGPALFWLDGHFMGENTARGEEDSPVRTELSALLAHPVRHHLVLIDDARLFTGTAGYPTIEELRRWIARERPGSDVQVEDDIIRCAFDVEDAVS